MPLVVFNQKGGVGKSTITCNLAAISASQGLSTLVIDLDQQGNSTGYLLGEAAQGDHPDVAGFFEQTLGFSLRPLDPGDYIVETPFEHLSEHYDRIYIDTPPALNFYTRSALIGARGCLIPFDCDEFSRQALYTLMDNVQEIRADHNPGLSVDGIVVNQFQPRANLPRRLVQDLIDDGLPVLQPYLPSSVKVRESHEQSTPMVYLDPSHKLTQALLALHEAVEAARAV